MTDLIAGCCVFLLGKLCPAVLSAPPDNKVHSLAGVDTKASFCIPPLHATTQILTYAVGAQFAKLMVFVLYYSMAVNFIADYFQ